MSDAVLLMAYGSPETLDEVEAYYTRIRGGRPPTRNLLESLLARYAAIGGGSPLSRIVEAQRAALAAELRRRTRAVDVYAAMRYTPPFIPDIVRRMATDGVDRAIGIALAPQGSRHGTAGYRGAVEAEAAALGPAAPAFRFVDSWHDEPGFVDALAAAARDALARFGDPGSVRVLFTAHSLPVAAIRAGDAYPDEVRRTAELVAGQLGLARFGVAYQSAGRTGEEWLGPDLRDEIRRLAAEGVRDALVCPVGFVADHLEVLYDIDIEAQAVARDAGVRLERTRSLNDDPTFIGGLADLVEAGLASEAVLT